MIAKALLITEVCATVSIFEKTRSKDIFFVYRSSSISKSDYVNPFFKSTTQNILHSLGNQPGSQMPTCLTRGCISKPIWLFLFHFSIASPCDRTQVRQPLSASGFSARRCSAFSCCPKAQLEFFLPTAFWLTLQSLDSNTALIRLLFPELVCPRNITSLGFRSISLSRIF